jgi:hypothetical protein
MTKATAKRTLVPKVQRQREDSLAAYIRTAREELTTLGHDWAEHRWSGVGTFNKLGTSRAPRARVIDPDTLLDSLFMEFAKASIRHRHSEEPRQTLSNIKLRLRSLRLLEAALLHVHGSADPLLIDLQTLTAAASLATSSFSGQLPGQAAKDVESLARHLVNRGILSPAVGHWVSPVERRALLGFRVGSEADRHRASKLPDMEAIAALAEIFNRKLDPQDERDHPAIYVTSVATLLCGAPSRGQEVHELPVDVLVRATDRFGTEQLGLRWEGSKGFGSFVKWVWNEMVPSVELALERVRAITEEARRLARHYENPKSRDKFYRHANCPDVGDDEPLTTLQASQALGYAHKEGLRSAGLVQANGAHTLRSLWRDYVLPRHRELHPHFPFIEKAKKGKERLKFSEALFCMLRCQLKTRAGAIPVFLWMPTLGTFSAYVGPSRGAFESIFDRYNYTRRDGEPLRLKSHQLRHLLNTEAQRTQMSDEMIAHWSGRANVRQNSVYDHRSAQEVVESVRSTVEQHEIAVRGDIAPVNRQDGFWTVETFGRLADMGEGDDIQPRLSCLVTEYGQCHHDWALSPCSGFISCLDCRDHRCIVGDDNTRSQERLQRVERLLGIARAEVAKAEAAQAEGDWGAQEWLDTQRRNVAKLTELTEHIRRLIDSGDLAVITLSTAPRPEHVNRAIRGIAMQARTNNTLPQEVVKRLLAAVDAGDAQVAPITIHRPTALPKPSAGAIEGGRHG